jgi:predicted RNA polymerase sigma factor
VSGGAEAGRAVDAVWRIESARLIAGLARMTGDVGLAEDLAQDALVAALERWPESGVQLTPSPVVELNRAVAVGMAFGPAAALELVDALVKTGELADYHLLFSVRADLFAKLDRPTEARAEFERAAAMTGNARERELQLARAAAPEPGRCG